MKVFKFGGASVKDPGGIENICQIISSFDDNLVIVVSAFGKTTNSLEEVVNRWHAGEKSLEDLLQKLKSYHLAVISSLKSEPGKIMQKFEVSFASLKEYLETTEPGDYDYDYDQIVSFGEVWSTIIVAGYLVEAGLPVKWIDARENLITDDRHRDANIMWGESIRRFKGSVDFKKSRIYLTQGFIGATSGGATTTLGREGSDYSAAIIANIMDAGEVVVWKDVPGILNADPQWLPDAEMISTLSYKEAVEMFFSGAKVIHPKTIKPLHNKGIPLFVRSFLNPKANGTAISAGESRTDSLPVFVRKEDQVLLSLIPLDFSFVMGENLGKVFHVFYKHGIKTNLVQASAVSIAVCVDNDAERIERLTEELNDEFRIRYNEDVEMVTLRYYTPEAMARVTAGKTILLEQKTRKSIRYVLKK